MLLPAAVSATDDQLRAIGATGSYRDMAKPADQMSGFRSKIAGKCHSEYWYLKMRPDGLPMEQMEKPLTFPCVVRPSTRGKVNIWPLMATLPVDQIVPATAREIDRLLGEGHANVIRNGLVWLGYVLSIAKEGTWLYFVSGAGCLEVRRCEPCRCGLGRHAMPERGQRRGREPGLKPARRC
jgi:hypothetical protein